MCCSVVKVWSYSWIGSCRAHGDFCRPLAPCCAKDHQTSLVSGVACQNQPCVGIHDHVDQNPMSVLVVCELLRLCKRCERSSKLAIGRHASGWQRMTGGANTMITTGMQAQA
jgi:hypothetical protein